MKSAPQEAVSTSYELEKRCERRRRGVLRRVTSTGTATGWAPPARRSSPATSPHQRNGRSQRRLPSERFLKKRAASPRLIISTQTPLFSEGVTSSGPV